MGSASNERPPSVDALARSLARVGLPHALNVDIAREAIAAGDWAAAENRAAALQRMLLQPVINATGVLLHTNLGRAPVGVPLPIRDQPSRDQPSRDQPSRAQPSRDQPSRAQPSRAQNVEFDLSTGERGSRQEAVGSLFARLCGGEAAMVVNNNAAAVMLVLAALAFDRGVAVSRGESVEIGGAFRVPDVMEQSGATLVDVGTTNRTRLSDYAKAIDRPGADIALTMKVHPSNFRVEGFVEATSVTELATLSVPVVADIGSGLIDNNCPWLDGPPPSWLAGEPAARQTLEAGAALVTFSGDKLLGGPQAGVIVGRRDLVERCRQHPLARAFRPGGHVLAMLQTTALAYLDRSAATSIPFWRMASTPVEQLRMRAEAIVADAGRGSAEPSAAMPGAGSAPGVTIDSFAVVVAGDRLVELRRQQVPIIARVRDARTILDLRSVDPGDDETISDALRNLE